MSSSNRFLTSLFLGSIIIPIGFLLPNLQLNIISALAGHLDTSQAHRTIIPIALFTMVLLAVKNINKLKIPTSYLDMSIYISFALLTASHLLNVPRGSSTLLYLDHMIFILFYIVGYNIKFDEFFKKTVLVACIASIVIYFAIIVLSSGSVFTKIINAGRSISEYRNLVPIIIYSIGYLFLFGDNLRKTKLTKLVAISTLLFILFSWSRTGVVFIGLLFFFSIVFGRTSVASRFFLLFVVLVSIISYQFIIEFLLKYSDQVFLLQRFISTGEEGDQNRLTLLLEGWRILISHPIIGNGFVTSMEIKQADGSFLNRPFAPHNQFVDIGIRTGLLGFLWFIGMNIAISYSLLRSKISIVSNFGIVWVCVLVACFTQNLLFNYSGYFLWTMAGICSREIAVTKRKKI